MREGRKELQEGGRWEKESEKRREGIEKLEEEG